MLEALNRNNNAFFRQLLFLSILIAIAAVMIWQLSFFVGAFLGAMTFYIVFRRLIFRMVERHKWRPWVASLTIVVAITLVLGGMGFLVGEIIAHEMASVDTAQLLVMAREAVPKINEAVGLELISPDMVKASSGVLMKLTTTILNTTYSFAANILMTVILLYFMLTHARTLENRIAQYLPFRGHNRAELVDDITSIIYSNAVVIPLTMLAQGLAAGVVYWAFGLPNVVFWAFVTALCGLLPMVGTVIVSVPLGIWFISDGFVWKGVMLMACGILIIANVDNLARIVLNKRISNTHPLVVIFGVILGIPLFGFWGIIFGPLLISVFLLLVRMYYTEYRLCESEPLRPVDPAVPPLDVETKGVEVAAAKEATKDAAIGDAAVNETMNETVAKATTKAPTKKSKK
jgi:predicted PurR-regulated permease PerM